MAHQVQAPIKAFRAMLFACKNGTSINSHEDLMPSSTYDFRQFQEELARLEGKTEKPKPKPKPAKPLGKKAAAARRLEMAGEEFRALRQRHELTVAEVVAFFPEEEGIAYLQQLIAEQARPRRARKS